MNIAFHVQPLIDNQKTGIGFCTAGLVDAMTKQHPGESFVFQYFSHKKEALAAKTLAPFLRPNVSLQEFSRFPDRYYRALWNFVPIPYSLFFPKQIQLTQFFNYYLPPGVRGITVSFIHDMCYKAVPDTVRLKTKIMLNLNLKRTCKTVNKIITISQFSKNEIIKYMGVAPEKIEVVYMGVDHDTFHPHLPPQAQQAVREKYKLPDSFFLYLGTLEPRKNLVRLLEAYALLVERLPTAPALVIAGRKGWMYDEIFSRVEALQLSQRVHFTGYVPDEEAPLLLSAATAFVFPSIYEGFGIPPLEAMACGTPVLTANAASLPEVVEDAAVLVDPFSVESIAEGLYQLASDATLRARLSEKGLIQAQKFHWEKSAEQLYTIYAQLLEQTGAKAD